MLHQNLLQASGVRLKTYLHRIEASLIRLEESWSALDASWSWQKQWFSYIHSQKSDFQPICFSNTFWGRLMCMWKRIWAGLKHLWAVLVLSHLKDVLTHLGCVLELAKQWFGYIFQKSSFQPICFNNPLWRRLVYACLNTHLRRLGASLTHFEGVLEQAKIVIWQPTSVKDQAFNSYASTTSVEGVLCAFENVFAPSWHGF